MRRSLRIIVAVIPFVLGACSCGDGGVGSTSAGFRTSTEALDFGKVLEGTEIGRSVDLVATGRGSITVDVAVTGPFRAPASVTLPGGGTAALEVVFTAPEGEATGTLVLSARGESFEIPLRGRGVRPLSCIPTAPCRNSAFVLETEQCEESMASDGASCVPEGVCLDDGVCRSGVCVGTPRTCDDGNACTQDACSEDVGCVHVDVSNQCPAPANPCEVATCSPVTGCGFGVREDAALCGTIDCVTAHLCQAGTCTAVPTPENFVCAAATPCRGEGRCSMGECVLPDAGTLTAAWTLPLGAAPVGSVGPVRLVGQGGNLYFAACGLQSQDGGCALSSYTGNGFLRFEQPLGDPNAVLHAVIGSQAWVQQDGGLSAHAAAGGAPLWTLPLVDAVPAGAGGPDGGARVRLPTDGLAAHWDGGVLLAMTVLPAEVGPGGSADGGVDAGSPDAGGPAVVVVHVMEDGGIASGEQVAGSGTDSALGLGTLGISWLHAAAGEVLTTITDSGDAGSVWRPVASVPAQGPFSVSEAGGWAFVGGHTAVMPDGGTLPLLSPVDGGFGEEAVGFEVLSANGMGFVFFRACRPPIPAPCDADERALMVRAFSLLDGAPLWEGAVLPPSFEGRLLNAALTGGPLTGGIVTLSEVALLGSRRTDVQLFVDDRRVMMCPLPGEPTVAGAALNGGVLYVLVDREGVRRLEGYDLSPLSFTQQGWPVAGSVGGSRRAR